MDDPVIETLVDGPAASTQSVDDNYHAATDSAIVPMIPEGQLATVKQCSVSCGSLASTQADVCRICHCEVEPGGAPLISPCACSGSMRYVHQSCLQQWIKSVNTKSCELCKLDFQMTTTIKPFRKWQKLDMSKVERRKLFCSVTFHVIAITCVVWSLYVLIDRTSEEVRAGVLEWPFWTKLIVVAIGFAGGIVFMYVQCRMYITYCRRWRAYNRVIYVQDCPSGRDTAGSGARKGTHDDLTAKISDQSESLLPTTGLHVELNEIHPSGNVMTSHFQCHDTQ